MIQFADEARIEVSSGKVATDVLPLDAKSMFQMVDQLVVTVVEVETLFLFVSEILEL